MDQSFWHSRWQQGDIGFHQARTNDLLERHWRALKAAPGSKVFVPLCGKSLDMVWLAEQGYGVVGAELSERAVDDFFAERGLAPSTTEDGALMIKSAGPFSLICGDIFDMTTKHLAEAGGVYDRAALIALPPEIRVRYAQKLAEIVPLPAAILLISVEYREGEIEGPPFSVPASEVDGLFAPNFEISSLEVRDGLTTSPNLKARGVSWVEERASLLRRRT